MCLSIGIYFLFKILKWSYNVDQQCIRILTSEKQNKFNKPLHCWTYAGHILAQGQNTQPDIENAQPMSRWVALLGVELARCWHSYLWVLQFRSSGWFREKKIAGLSYPFWLDTCDYRSQILQLIETVNTSSNASLIYTMSQCSICISHPH